MGYCERTVGDHQAEDRPPRQATARAAIGVQRCVVDLSYWSAMGGHACPLSALPDLSPLPPAMEQGRGVGQGVVQAGLGSARSRDDRHHRMLHRWRLLKCKKRGLDIGPTKRGKGTKVMVIADAAGLPIAVRTYGASTHEVKLVTDMLLARFVREVPQRMIGDRANDSDQLDAEMRKKRVKLIAPHRGNHKRKATQDGRELRRCKRRWTVERLFAWIGNYRRTVTRYEYHSVNFLGFIQLACAAILMRQLF